MRNPESASLQIPARAGNERESSLFRLGEDHGRCEELGWAAPMDPPAQGERNVHTVHRGTGEVRLGASMDGSGCHPGCLAAAKPISGSPVKWRSAERKSEKGVVAMIGVDNTTRRSEGPLARCATATAKTPWVEELRGSLGPVANPGGVRGMLLADCLGESRVR